VAKVPVTITEAELWGYFERGPETDEYGGLTYRAWRDGYAVQFGIDLANHDVSLALVREDRKIFELVALSVPDVRWRGDGSRERIEIVMGDRHSVFLEINPTVAVVHHWGIEIQI
jgi:hypothetical protein